MVAPSGQNTASPLIKAYGEFDTNLRLRQAKVCCVLSLVLVPSCVGLDYFVYPALLWPIFKARLLCDLALVPPFLALFTPFGRRHIRLLGHAPAAIPAFSICWMIYASEGAFSPYYAGLNIVMVGLILLIPYTLREAALLCAFVFLCYSLACLLHRSASSVDRDTAGATSRTLFNNLYFLSMTAVIALTACYYSSRRRFQEFRLRHELDLNNQALAATVKKLQDTEVQLVQSEKMNALGKLSAGLLHEINNPLNFTFMALQVAEGEAGDNASLKETLADINQGMTRIKSVIADLRAFAYPSRISDAEPFALDDALRTAMRLTAHELGEVSVDTESVRGARALGAKTQIVHVFMNLLVNSAQAMRSKTLGRPPKITVSCAPRAGKVEVSVRDNGCGVRAADLPRLFEPFFTTKPPGEGTGLGLSICHTIVQNHGGNIAVASEEGQWTQVTFALPLAVTGNN